MLQSTSHLGFGTDSLPVTGTDLAPYDDATDLLQPQPRDAPTTDSMDAADSAAAMMISAAAGYADAPQQSQSAKLVQQLTQWWINEKCAPALLPFQFEVVEPLADYLLDSAEKVARQRRHINNTDELVRAELMELEVERIKYVLKSYLLARLRKVEVFASQIVADKQLQDYLSSPELEYCKSYEMIRRDHLKKSCFEGFPEELCSFPTVNPENPRHPVFVRVLDDVGEVVLGDGGLSLPMKKGQIFLIQYGYVKSMLLRASVELI